ncbi:unnamed protein product [Prorocentrum cordatum]|uniref:Uncharacterized protein n=1 Tax=Prorocentrum cordatum TaxID=2364126 RepID=A0ABN9XWK6_9DINO|nr:unnamed protein product [Polarella glacialis]
MAPSVAFHGSQAIAAHGRARRWAHALSLLAGLDRRGGRPNVVAWGAAVGACAWTGAWPAALALLAELGRRGGELNAIVYGGSRPSPAGKRLPRRGGLRRCCGASACPTQRSAGPCSRPARGPSIGSARWSSGRTLACGRRDRTPSCTAAS